ncbi:HAD family hydrolase [Rhizobium anhuiense]|uniref:HAD family hydrolase n=1 Tax=Rhizobium anhuiense TaxID=1184720 RepID=A0A3S0XES7_9HYPH|nr:HAD family hydrolase [Rhizobium anhuiense]RUL98253.1 HAD family hydrolase [Rhizobium anhuiense]GGE00147.1 HAD superfamily hydrolase [Rhizobium anhuiense]
MILIFDLDDTLYDESKFVDSGLAAVASHGHARWGWDAEPSLATLRETLTVEGRGKVFDRWLESHGKWSRARVAECVKVYRHHRPNLELWPSGSRMLSRFGGRVPLYLVTDGHKIVQRNKVDALGLWPEFRRVFITHRFGRAAAKPSTLCFQRILDLEGCTWRDLVYVGDNPAKDFVGLNPLGALTVRVLTGAHACVRAEKSYDGHKTILDLDELPAVLSEHFGEI